jgi:hypothetical protein
MTAKEKIQLLENIVRKVVSEEIRNQLPSLLERVITENYLRNMVNSPRSQPQPAKVKPNNVVAEKKRTGPPSLFEILATDEEPEEYNEVPQLEPNEDLGIYQNKGRNQNESIQNKLLDPEQNPLAFLYEGVNPTQESPLMNAPVEHLGLDRNNMMELAGITNKKEISSQDREKELEMKEKLLEMKRQRLQSTQISTPGIIKESKPQESSLSKVLERAQMARSKHDFGMR